MKLRATYLKRIGSEMILKRLMIPAGFQAGEAAYDPLVLFFLLAGILGLVAIRFNLVEKPRWVCLAWLVGAFVNMVVSHAWLVPVTAHETSVRITALSTAAWACVAGVTAALMVCVMVVKRINLSLDPKTTLLMLAAFPLGLGWHYAVPVVVALLAAAWGTPLIFSAQERKELRRDLSTRTD